MSTQKTNQSLNTTFSLSVLLLISSMITTSMATDPSDETFTIGDDTPLTDEAPYFYGTFDAAGFSDIIYWGDSPNHGCNYHEVLSGEWGAAIFYDSISTEPNAMWLTNKFLFPDIKFRE